MKKLRSYFEEKFGDLANNLTDGQIEDLVISLVKGKSVSLPSSQPLNENVVSDTNGRSVGGVKFPKFNVTEPKCHNVPPYYDIEIEGVTFSQRFLSGKYNKKPAVIENYAGTVVEDKIGIYKRGMSIGGGFDKAFDIKGGMIIEDGRVLFVRGVSIMDIPITTQHSVGGVADMMKTQPMGISGSDRFVVKEDVFERNWKKFFTKAESKDGIETIYPTVTIDRDSSRGFVNIIINTAYRTDGIDYPSLIFNSVTYNSAKHGIVKSQCT